MCVHVHLCVFVCVRLCLSVSRVFEVPAGSGGGEDLQDETAAGEDQEGLGRCQETGLFLFLCACFLVCPAGFHNTACNVAA